MATDDGEKQTRPAGITHAPLEEEERSQAQIQHHPDEGRSVSGAQGGSGRGHRLSRKGGHQAQLDSENSFEGKGGKGGKTGGSRAGLLASRKVPKGSWRVR